MSVVISRPPMSPSTSHFSRTHSQSSQQASSTHHRQHPHPIHHHHQHHQHEIIEQSPSQHPPHLQINSSIPSHHSPRQHHRLVSSPRLISSPRSAHTPRAHPYSRRTSISTVNPSIRPSVLNSPPSQSIHLPPLSATAPGTSLTLAKPVLSTSFHQTVPPRSITPLALSSPPWSTPANQTTHPPPSTHSSRHHHGDSVKDVRMRDHHSRGDDEGRPMLEDQNIPAVTSRPHLDRSLSHQGHHAQSLHPLPLYHSTGINHPSRSPTPTTGMQTPRSIPQPHTEYSSLLDPRSQSSIRRSPPLSARPEPYRERRSEQSHSSIHSPSVLGVPLPYRVEHRLDSHQQHRGHVIHPQDLNSRHAYGHGHSDRPSSRDSRMLRHPEEQSPPLRSLRRTDPALSHATTGLSHSFSPEKYPGELGIHHPGSRSLPPSSNYVVDRHSTARREDQLIRLGRHGGEISTFHPHDRSRYLDERHEEFESSSTHRRPNTAGSGSGGGRTSSTFETPFEEPIDHTAAQIRAYRIQREQSQMYAETPAASGTGGGQSRRIAHLMSEQKRRELTGAHWSETKADCLRSINTGFTALRAVVPSTSPTDSKAVVLRKAANHIGHLEEMLHRAEEALEAGIVAGSGMLSVSPKKSESGRSLRRSRSPSITRARSRSPVRYAYRSEAELSPQKGSEYQRVGRELPSIRQRRDDYLGESSSYQRRPTSRDYPMVLHRLDERRYEHEEIEMRQARDKRGRPDDDLAEMENEYYSSRGRSARRESVQEIPTRPILSSSPPQSASRSRSSSRSRSTRLSVARASDTRYIEILHDDQQAAPPHGPIINDSELPSNTRHYLEQPETTVDDNNKGETSLKAQMDLAKGEGVEKP